MAFLSCRVTVVAVRASWDTQQMRPYNRNSPRKTNKPVSPFLSPPRAPTSTPTPTSKTSQLQIINVDDLLKFNSTATRLGEAVLEENTYLGYDRWVPSPPKLEKPRSSHNAAALAYIGDCIYEVLTAPRFVVNTTTVQVLDVGASGKLYARRHFLAPALNIEQFNDRVMAIVRCEAQDALLQKLLKENFLTVEERDVLRWGKNITSAKTRTTKRVGIAAYNRASSLETLIGYLYLTNPTRLEDMMSVLGFSVNVSNQTILEDLNLELQKVKQKRVKGLGALKPETVEK